MEMNQNLSSEELEVERSSPEEEILSTFVNEDVKIHMDELLQNEVEETEQEPWSYWYTKTPHLNGILFFVISTLFTSYLIWYLERELYFSELLEIEREISFRSEQGFYYAFYKNLVEAPSFSSGIESLLTDNMTESGHVINALKCFNIYPEVTLAFLYQALSISWLIRPIHFYVNMLFLLNGIGVGILFLIAQLVTRSKLAGVAAVMLYIQHKQDTTRVFYALPLRENFAIPFLYAQTYSLMRLMKNSESIRWKLALLLSTTCFVFCWQLSQYILFLQGIVLYFMYTMKLLQNIKTIFRLFFIALCLGIVFHFGQTHLFASPAIIFFLYCLMEAHNSTDLVFWKAITRPIIAAFISWTSMVGIKLILKLNDDDHITYFFLHNIFGTTPTFDTLLYTCNGGFERTTTDVLLRIQPVLNLYGWSVLFIFLNFFFYLSSHSINYRTLPKSVFQWCHRSPHVFYLTSFSLCLGALAFTVTRFKFLASGFFCCIALVCVAELPVWTSKHRWIDWTNKRLCFILILALLATSGLKQYNTLIEESADIKEFYDPDTVNLMFWIRSNTDASAVFAGSMQLLAGVRLCTGRAITNHPHYEREWLRERTKNIYNIYGREKPEIVYQALKNASANYIILEDSICLRRDPCGLPKIVDFSSIPTGNREKSFCEEVRFERKPYSSYFKLVYKNDTFKVYKIIEVLVS